MKAALLLLAAFPAAACDWTLTESIDSMTDQRVCQISSAEAKVSLFMRGGNIRFVSESTYRNGRDSLTLRIDDNKPLVLGRNPSNFSSFPPDSENARKAIDEIMEGQRLRTSFLDLPNGQEGDAPICNLPELILACQTP